jgi:hypothetical protein
MSVEMASQACVKCSFCKKIADDIKKAIAQKTHIKAFILSDFVVKPPFENPIHKDCECGRMFMCPPQDLTTLKIAMLKILTPNPLERNACGCLIDRELRLCQRMNTFNCCGKCSKAIEMKMKIQMEQKPFAIIVECSCHFMEPVKAVIPVSIKNVDEQIADN